MRARRRRTDRRVSGRSRMQNHRRFPISLLGLLVAAAAVWAAFPDDADTPTEGWKYGFRSVIDTAQYPNAQDKEGASGMSLEAGWKDIAHWPRLASSGGDFSSEGRPDVVVGYIEGGVNYWRNGADQLIKKIYINRAEVMANPTGAGTEFTLDEPRQGSLGAVLTSGGRR